MNPTIRPMTEADLDAARALWTTAEGVELSEGDSRAELARYLQRNPGLSCVAVAGDRLVGAVLAGHDGRRGYLYHLSVAAEARGHGVGRALTAHAIASLQATGIPRAFILVARDNPGGHAFWTHLGWEPLDFADVLGRDL